MKQQIQYLSLNNYMKKLLIIALAVSLLSCNKKYCWKCTISTITSGNGTNNVIRTNTTPCDMSKEEIEVYKKSQTHLTSAGPVIINQSVSCNQQ